MRQVIVFVTSSIDYAEPQEVRMLLPIAACYFVRRKAVVATAAS
jgi:hypothetical protein